MKRDTRACSARRGGNVTASAMLICRVNGPLVSFATEGVRNGYRGYRMERMRLKGEETVFQNVTHKFRGCLFFFLLLSLSWAAAATQ